MQGFTYTCIRQQSTEENDAVTLVVDARIFLLYPFLFSTIFSFLFFLSIG